MTTDVQTPVTPYIANGATTVFPFDWHLPASGDLIVQVNGLTKTLTADYTISGVGSYSGGSVTFLVAPVSGAKVTLFRRTRLERTTDYQENGDLLALTLNGDLDRIIRILQDLVSGAQSVPNTLRVPAGETLNELPSTASRAGYYQGWDANGQPALLLAASGTAASLATDLADGTDVTKGDAKVAVKVNTPSAVALNLHDWVEDDGAWNLMGFLPQNLKAALRARTSTTNISTYVQNCIDAIVAERTYGQMRVPMMRGYLEAALEMKLGVSILGSGRRASLFECVNIHPINFNFFSGEAGVELDNFGLNGASGTDKIAIYQPGSDSVANELYDVTLRRLYITNFNKALKVKQARDWKLDSVWGQHINTALDLTGRNLLFRFRDCQFVKGNGNGAGASDGLLTDYGSFNGGGTLAGPEGVMGSRTQFFGFNSALRLVVANSAHFEMLDIMARVYGVEVTTVQQGLTIRGIHCEMQDLAAGSALAGFIAHGLASTIESKILVEGGSFKASSTTSCTGAQINDSGNQNQNNVTLRSLSFDGFNVRDVQLYAAGPTVLEDLTCRSNVTGLNSISVDSVVKGTVHVSKVHCLKDIGYAAADLTSGELQIHPTSRFNDTALIYGDETITTVASAAALTLPVGSSRAFKISGTTNITSIVASGWTGKTIRLIFADVLTLTDGSNLRLAGNFVTSADDAIALSCDGTNWFESSRSAN